MGSNKFLLVILVISIVVNILFGFFYFSKKSKSSFINSDSASSLEKKYPLISRRILRDLPQDILISFLSLRKDLQDQVSSYNDSFGFYFEYLPTGSSIGVNGSLEFHAASLFKVPVIMAYLRSKERLGLKDDPEIEITPGDIDNEFGTLGSKGAGTKVRSSELIRLALQESDNTAAKAIASSVTDDDFKQVYQNLDIDLQSDNKGAIVSAKSYSSVLKALYFSSVLGKDNSNLILDFLTKSKFDDKLKAGVPGNIIVAHKIGDFIDKEDQQEAFMDCGIVYIPKRPYILCMVSKTDEKTAAKRMHLLSKTIYDYISSIQ